MPPFNNVESDALADLKSVPTLLGREGFELVHRHVLHLFHVLVELVFDFHEFGENYEGVSALGYFFGLLLRFFLLRYPKITNLIGSRYFWTSLA